LTTGSAIPASTDADLRSLTVNAGTLNPVFGYSGTSYGTIVTGTSISVTSTFDNPNAAATVALNSGSALPMYSGQPSSSFALASDTNNQIVVTVTSEDWWTSGKSKTYTLNVYRIDAPVGRDPALGVSGVTLNSSVDKLVTTGGTCVFEYGKTAGYGQSVTAVRDVASPTAVSAALTGFETMPAYGVWHYRLTMFYGNAVYYGPDRTFTLSFPGTTPVAVTGDSVPGVSGAAFSSFGTPVVNGNGDVAFRATISGAGLAAGSNSLIWVESNPNGFLVARTGMAASAGVVSSLNSPAIDSQGAVAFLARTGSNTGLWASTSGALSLLACTQTFSQVPELVGGRFSAFSTVVLPDSGGPIFEASLAPRFGDVSTGNAKGLWRADSDDRLWTVVRSGEHDFIATNSGKVFREVLGPLPKTPAGRRQWIETEPNGHWTHAYSVDGRAHFAPAGWHDAMERPIPGVPPGCSRWIVLQDGRYDAVSGNVGMMFGPLPSAPKGSALWLASAKNNSWKWAFGSGKVKPAVASPWRVVWGPLSAPSAGTVHWALVNLDGRVTVVDRPAKLHSPAVLDSFEAFSPTAEVSGQKRSFNRFGEVVLATAFADKTARIVHVDPSLVRTVVRSAGSVAPDVAKGTFSLFYQPAINDLNHLAFRAILSGSGITAENHAGIWADFGRFHKLVARTGASAPGVHHGVFGELNDPLFNNADQVAFVGTLRTGPGGVTKANASGLWMTRMEGKSRALRLVARERSTAVPGYPAGVYFSTFQRIALLESGRVVLLATLTGNVASADGYGIWATDAAGQLRLIARKGGGLMVDGVGKTIVALSILTGSGETVGQTRGFNDTGEIVYLASFSDGSHGIFRARVD